MQTAPSRRAKIGIHPSFPPVSGKALLPACQQPTPKNVSSSAQRRPASRCRADPLGAPCTPASSAHVGLFTSQTRRTLGAHSSRLCRSIDCRLRECRSIEVDRSKSLAMCGHRQHRQPPAPHLAFEMRVFGSSTSSQNRPSPHAPTEGHTFRHANHEPAAGPPLCRRLASPPSLGIATDSGGRG